MKFIIASETISETHYSNLADWISLLNSEGSLKAEYTNFPVRANYAKENWENNQLTLERRLRNLDFFPFLKTLQ